MQETENLFGARLRKARISRGLSQAELAAQVGVIQAHISHLEVGRYTPSFDLLLKITEALRVDAGYFLDPRLDGKIAEATVSR